MQCLCTLIFFSLIVTDREASCNLRLRLKAKQYVQSYTDDMKKEQLLGLVGGKQIVLYTLLIVGHKSYNS